MKNTSISQKDQRIPSEYKHIIKKETEAYYSRNKNKFYSASADRIIDAAKTCLIHFEEKEKLNWLEIGCSRGDRFSHLEDLGFTTYGVEPGHQAVSDGRKANRRIMHSDAINCLYNFNFDVIHLGFFL